jgi:peptidoglycan/xylan/chitin deacetylase (PgdA/CDA1 family)
MDPISPHGPVEVAITVDELALWDGSPIPAGYSPASIVKTYTDTFAAHSVTGVYGFAHTYPFVKDPGLRDVLEHWVETGHHLGNHTQLHASLNWVDSTQYIDDIKRAEDDLGDLLTRAPSRLFRYAMDMSGPEEGRRGDVEDYLRVSGYTNAPITAWFGDFAWIAPYYRAKVNGDGEALEMLRTTYVQAAVFHLHSHAKAARQLYDSDVPYIWLIHGSPVGADCLDTILSAFEASGVTFVSLEKALEHHTNRTMPPVNWLFRNHLERALIANGIERDQVPAELVQAVLAASPLEGYDSFDVYENKILRPIVDRINGTWLWSWE